MPKCLPVTLLKPLLATNQSSSSCEGAAFGWLSLLKDDLVYSVPSSYSRCWHADSLLLHLCLQEDSTCIRSWLLRDQQPVLSARCHLHNQERPGGLCWSQWDLGPRLHQWSGAECLSGLEAVKNPLTSVREQEPKPWKQSCNLHSYLSCGNF